MTTINQNWKRDERKIVLPVSDEVLLKAVLLFAVLWTWTCERTQLLLKQAGESEQWERLIYEPVTTDNFICIFRSQTHDFHQETQFLMRV